MVNGEEESAARLIGSALARNLESNLSWLGELVLSEETAGETQHKTQPTGLSRIQKARP